jgi:hypothetical protein
LENLLIILCLKRGIGEGAIRNYLKGKRQKPPYLFNVAATNARFGIVQEADDYYLKKWIKGESNF